MNDSHLHFEPSLATKKLNLPTRKPRIVLQQRIHPGLVSTANAYRDVALMFFAFGLEGASLALLYSKLPFSLGVVAGFAVFDTAGAFALHNGSADAHERAAKIAAAETPEEEAALAAQRPGHFKYVRALGLALIVGSFAFKMISLFKLRMALMVLGAFAPALVVSFATIMVIHLFVTGYGLAWLRYRWAESRERSAMLRSGALATQRDRHGARILSSRVYTFSTYLPLREIEHVDGHSLRHEGTDAAGAHLYALRTHGRFHDRDLKYFIDFQFDPASKAEMCVRGLRHQLDIEQSEPLNGSAPTGPTRLRKVAPAVVTALMAACVMGLTGCGPEKAEALKITIASTEALPAPGGKLPETVLALLAPSKPLAGHFVPQGEIVRLDLDGEKTESLVPAAETGVERALDAAWKIESAELELARNTEDLQQRGAGIIAKASAQLPASEAIRRLAELATQARNEQREVIAITKTANSGAIQLPGVAAPIDACGSCKEAGELIERKLQSGAAPSVLVLLNPPIDGTAQVAEETEEATGQKIAPPPSETSAPLEKDRRETHESSPSSTSQVETVIVNVAPNAGTSPSVDLRLPPGAQPIGEPIYFDSKSSKLNDHAQRVVEAIAAEMTRTGRRHVILVAEADPVGGENSNHLLAERRGQAVEAALVHHCITVQSLLAIGDSLTPDAPSPHPMRQYRVVRAYATEATATAKH